MSLPGQNPNDKFYPVDILRNWVYNLDFKEYKMKLEIVEEFAGWPYSPWDK